MKHHQASERHRAGVRAAHRLAKQKQARVQEEQQLRDAQLLQIHAQAVLGGDAVSVSVPVHMKRARVDVKREYEQDARWEGIIPDHSKEAGVRFAERVGRDEDEVLVSLKDSVEVEAGTGLGKWTTSTARVVPSTAASDVKATTTSESELVLDSKTRTRTRTSDWESVRDDEAILEEYEQAWSTSTNTTLNTTSSTTTTSDSVTFKKRRARHLKQ